MGKKRTGLNQEHLCLAGCDRASGIKCKYLLPIKTGVALLQGRRGQGDLASRHSELSLMSLRPAAAHRSGQR